MHVVNEPGRQANEVCIGCTVRGCRSANLGVRNGSSSGKKSAACLGQRSWTQESPCQHSGNGSRGQWQVRAISHYRFPRSSNGVLQKLNPGPPAYRVATSCHSALAHVQPKTVCVQENQCRCFGSCLTRRVSISELAAQFSKANKEIEQRSNEGW
ncbi:hypothetical protein L211DRAFT_152886 [Terfezia boudieri ATCC MYA-4762]|uniref:Uncharacterized protein n=1 Tax=Terfezia boudieri ATCC MYA-4762 TaxID=1051890 RepID=A0A3N4LW10_9PEZI|nr:hypothetical protein L211DRAFT_152886 [Terfezia boudieri ATCC MYA-4762]